MTLEARNYLVLFLRHESMHNVGTRICYFGYHGLVTCQNDPCLLKGIQMSVALHSPGLCTGWHLK